MYVNKWVNIMVLIPLSNCNLEWHQAGEDQAADASLEDEEEEEEEEDSDGDHETMSR